jgi:NTP pyrophosphatase (non-canonical NTP hydrolase)
MTDILTLQRDIHQNAIDHGFWEASEDIPTKLMLIVSELSEALEEYRDGHMYVRLVSEPSPGGPEDFAPTIVKKPEGFPIEIADVVIRCMDLCGHLGFDLGAMVELKMEYNATRPHLHGRKI